MRFVTDVKIFQRKISRSISEKSQSRMHFRNIIQMKIRR